MATLRGSCQCGGVRFELPDEFLSMSFCHCATCKKPDEGSAKTFCSVCGSNLFGSGWPHSEVTSVRLSAIDTPFGGRPEGHIYVRSLAAWETLPDDGLERFEAGRR